MANLKTEKSMRSLMQVTNIDYHPFDDEVEFDEDSIDFCDVMAAAVGRFGCPVSVVVDNILDIYHEIKPGKSKSRQKKVVPLVKTILSENRLPETPKEPMVQSTLVITASHNIQNHLVEISMNKYRFCTIPRIVMHCLRHILPKYTKLNKFKINDCAIDKFTIYELNSMLCTTKITDVCLDSTFLREGNYHILLEEATSLKHLSLSRCKINDEVCQLIFARLDAAQPAEKLLLTLNLSSNRITDVGVKSIGEVLRKNRHLRYLNLADNLITDEGAMHIFNALTEFPLLAEEIMDKRARNIKYLKIKHTIYRQCLQNIETKIFEKPRRDSITKKPTKKKKVTSLSQKTEKPSVTSDIFPIHTPRHIAKAEMMTLELIGPFVHPFDKAHITIKDGYPYCHGNLILSYLNLAYNDLTYLSLKKLLVVIQSQQNYIISPACGLMKVVLDGNNLPSHCYEIDAINDILNGRIIRQCLSSRPTRTSFSGKSAEKKTSVKSSPALKVIH